MGGGNRMKGIVTGCILGAAAVVAFGMMNRQTQKKMYRAATQAGAKMMHKANELMGK